MSSTTTTTTSGSIISGTGTLVTVDPTSGLDSSLELTLTPAVSASSSAEKQKKTGLVLVVDRSGSMAGTFSRQVVPSLQYVAKRSLELDVPVKLILYDSRAEIVRFTRDDYAQVIGRLNTQGSTSFKSAFAMTWLAVQELPPDIDHVVIGFLTDGQNTDAPYDAALAELKANLRAARFTSTCHAIAFSAGHDFAFLNTLRTTLGSVEGGFQYAEPSDGPNALEEKLSAVFDVAAVARLDCALACSVPGFAFVSQDAVGAELLVDQLNVLEHVVAGTQFVVRGLCRRAAALDDGATHVEVLLRCTIDGGALFESRVQVRLQRVDKSKTGALRAQQNIARLEALEAECGAAASSGKVNTAALSAKLDRAVRDMAELQGSENIFALCGTKNQRRAMFEQLQAFSTKAAEISSILATIATGTLSNVQKARLSELAHGQQFKQARRQRDLDQRSVRNVATLKAAEAALQSVTVDRDAIAQIADDAVNEFRCVLTQESWRDLISEDDVSERDVICFGMAVQRPESIIEDPTQLRIRGISVTTVGYSAFSDAVVYKLATDQRFARSDSFDVTGEVSVALRGMGREPINAVMPLYIHAEHWKMVLPQLPALLGYLCALDPLGFNSNQTDCFFLILGTMAMSLRAPGERDLRLLLQFHRTAIAVLHDCKWFKRAEAAVAAFVASPASRLKDQCPNLVVLIGYLMCLPTSTVDTLLPTPEAWRKFWLDVFGESLRRASDGVYTSDKADDARLLVSLLVDGDEADAPLSDNALAAHDFCDAKRGSPASYAGQPPHLGGGRGNDDDEDGGAGGGKQRQPRAAAAAGAAAPVASIALSPAAKAAKASARRRRHQLPAALVVDAAVESEVATRARTLLGIDTASGSAQTTGDADPWRCEHVSARMLDALREFEKSLASKAFPTVAGMLSLATYTRIFHTLARDRGGVKTFCAELDAAHGLASVDVCNTIKAAFVARGEHGNGLLSPLVALNDPQCGGAADASQTLRTAVQQVRATVVRGVHLRVNKTAREACEANTEGSGTTFGDANVLLIAAHQRIRTETKVQEERKTRSCELDHCIASCLRTSDLNVFIGWLVAERGFGGTRFSVEFRTLMDHFAKPNANVDIQLAAEKLAILLSGRVQHNGTEVFVLDNGRCWAPGAVWLQKLQKRHESVSALVESLKSRAAAETAELKRQGAEKRVVDAAATPAVGAAVAATTTTTTTTSKGKAKQALPDMTDAGAFPALQTKKKNR